MQPEFDLLTPATLDEALQMLSDNAPHVTPIAGGTNVVVNLRKGAHCDEFLVDVSHLPELRGIKLDEGMVVVGGGTIVAELLASPLIETYGKPLHEAAVVFANPLVRNRATVAGNIVDASPAADLVPALMALKADVELSSSQGARRVPLCDFIVGVNQTLRRPDELLVSVRWPVPPAGAHGGFIKLALRKGTACSVISAAVQVQCDADHVCTKAQVVLGAVATTAIHVPAAEEALVGHVLDKESIVRAGREAYAAAKPIDDVRSGAAYRKQMADVLVRRLLDRAAAELN